MISTQVPAFMVFLGLSHLLFCLVLLPVRAAYLRPVSYTHLTLPTICSV